MLNADVLGNPRVKVCGFHARKGLFNRSTPHLKKKKLSFAKVNTNALKQSKKTNVIKDKIFTEKYQKMCNLYQKFTRQLNDQNLNLPVCSKNR